MQETSSARENYEHLLELELADFDDVSNELPVGLLIGADYYLFFHKQSNKKIIWTSCLRNYFGFGV